MSIIANDQWSRLASMAPMAGPVALLALGASVVLPAGGLGIDICALHRLTGLPCPGCGLTRAFVAVSDGELWTAIGLNPFVVVLYPLFVAIAGVWLLPRGMRSQIEGWLAARGRVVGAAIQVGLVAFIGFGGARFAWFLLAGERFP